MRGGVFINRQFYYQKLIKSGDVYELFDYERGVCVGETRNDLGRASEASCDEKKRHRKTSLSRAKTTVRRLINANIDAWGEKPKFLTLTFAENIQDITAANYEFKKFRQRLEYITDIKLKYIVVIEFQKRGAVHYHVIFFNLPYVQAVKLAEVWRNGFIKINDIDQVDNIGAYVSKYMTKDQSENEKQDRLVGKKSYFTSRGLKDSENITDKKEIEQLMATLSQHEIYSSQFENEYLGNISYKQYNLKR